MSTVTHLQAPKVTAVVLSFNRREDLLETVEALHSVEYPELDVLVIDNGSEDGSPEAVTERFENVRCLVLPYNIATSARDYAVTATDAKYLVHFDQDCAPEPNAFSRMVQLFEEHPEVGVIPFNVIGGPYTTQYMEGMPSEDLVGFINCAVGMRPEAVKDAGYLDPDFKYYAEDWDLAIRIRNRGWKFLFDPGIRAYHRTPDDARDLKLRRKSQARNETWMAFKYYPLHRLPVMILRVLYWNVQGARAEGHRSSPWYAVTGVAAGCWRWRVAFRKREAIDPKILEAFERRSGFMSMLPISPRLYLMVARRLRTLARRASRAPGR